MCGTIGTTPFGDMAPNKMPLKYGLITEDLRGLKINPPILGRKDMMNGVMTNYETIDEIEAWIAWLKKKHPDVKTGQ